MTGWLAVFVLATSTGDFDRSHRAFTHVLEKRVKEGAVDYAGLRGDRAGLDAYLKTFEGVSREEYDGWSETEKIAFWINAYNGYTLKLVIDHDPVESIKDLGGFFSSVFSKEFIPLRKLHGGDMSLEDIEHSILRKEFSEPRLHFALVCASQSCPPLRVEAYRAVDLEAQLEDQAKTFLGDGTKNRYDSKKKVLHLSKIFDWFEDDFEKGGGSVRSFVSRFLDVPGETDIEYLDYDWSLNGT